MKVEILVETGGKRRMEEVEGIETESVNFALTPWGKSTDLFNVTHIPTGRACNRGPMSRATAMAFVHEIRSIRDWSDPIDTPLEDL